jgi:putative oxygen-independent coproporphyrinogen III oxidase
MEKNLGIYIHIPFCASKCSYCDFYSLADCKEKMDDYLEAVIQHIYESASSLQQYEIDTVYFGGGTPSYFGARRICDLFQALKDLGNVLRDSEVTMEANPDSIRLEDLKLLRRNGINRISLGMQSANNDILRLIGRRHNFQQVQMAVRNARKAGIENISLDLIYGLPSQSKRDWADTLAKAIELHPSHISCYGLQLETGTPLYERYHDSPMIPSDDDQADMYLYAVETLRTYGYNQYEISNFALPGMESRHNLKYWKLQDYIGFGPGAASCVGRLRYSYIRDLDAYIRGFMEAGDILAEREIISDVARASEYIMLGLRTTDGINQGEYQRIYRSDWAPIEKRLQEFRTRGWADTKEDRWFFTPSGFLVSNQLIEILLEEQAGEKVQINPWMQKAFDRQFDNTSMPEDDEDRFRAIYDSELLKYDK